MKGVYTRKERGLCAGGGESGELAPLCLVALAEGERSSSEFWMTVREEAWRRK